MKIIVDRSRCTGIGMCESVDPDRFEVDDDGTLVLLAQTVDEQDLALAQEAARACPALALSLSES